MSLRLIRDGLGHRPNLLYVRTGAQSLLPSWFKHDAARSWDLIISCYEAELPEIYASPAFQDATLCIGGRSKFESFAELHAIAGDRLTAYQATMFLDDDILLQFDDIEMSFSYFTSLKMQLAQPSLARGSYVSWRITRQRRKYLVRYTNFVEIMMPIMSAEALRVCLASFTMSVSGWGLDFLWPKLLGYPADAIGIIDAVAVRHMKPVKVKSGRFYQYLRGLGVDPVAEMIDVRRPNDLQRAAIKPKILGGIKGAAKIGDVTAQAL